MSDPKKLAVNLYAESTPNPNAMKFVCDTQLLEDNDTLELKTISEAQKMSPLATEIMKFPFVNSVFIAPYFITVLKHDYANWENVVNGLREMIRDLIIIGIPAKIESSEIEAREEKKKESVKPITTDETSQKIIEILDEYVKPAVESDGGTIQFRSFKNGVVKVAMGGACSGCPSTTITLKNGVEHLLKQMLPDKVREVETDDV